MAFRLTDTGREKLKKALKNNHAGLVGLTLYKNVANKTGLDHRIVQKAYEGTGGIYDSTISALNQTYALGLDGADYERYTATPTPPIEIAKGQQPSLPEQPAALKLSVGVSISPAATDVSRDASVFNGEGQLCVVEESDGSSAQILYPKQEVDAEEPNKPKPIDEPVTQDGNEATLDKKSKAVSPIFRILRNYINVIVGILLTPPVIFAVYPKSVVVANYPKKSVVVVNDPNLVLQKVSPDFDIKEEGDDLLVEMGYSVKDIPQYHDFKIMVATRASLDDEHEAEKINENDVPEGQVSAKIHKTLSGQYWARLAASLRADTSERYSKLITFSTTLLTKKGR